MTLPELVETSRLTLRRYRVDDAPALGAAIAASVDHLRPWMAWIEFEPVALREREQLIERWDREWRAGGDAVIGVWMDGDLVGSSGLHRRHGPGTLDIGYWVHADHVRTGIAREITVGLTNAAFGVAGIDEVYVQTDEANVASAAVPAALGFRRAEVIEREPQAPGESGRLIEWITTPDTWNPPRGD